MGGSCDVPARGSVRRAIDALVARRAAVVIATHDLAEAEAVGEDDVACAVCGVHTWIEGNWLLLCDGPRRWHFASHSLLLIPQD